MTIQPVTFVPTHASEFRAYGRGAAKGVGEHYVVAFSRILALPDTAVVATEGAKPAFLASVTVLKICNPDGDHQRSKGVRSETRIPPGKIEDFRKF